jgi:hypothetical protein
MSPFLVKLWQALISGLSIGSIYALIAEGYYITFITTGALNFGQGEFLMIGPDHEDRWTCAAPVGDRLAGSRVAAPLPRPSTPVFRCEETRCRACRGSAASEEWSLETLISILASSSRSRLVARGNQSTSWPVRNPIAKIRLLGWRGASPRFRRHGKPIARDASMRFCNKWGKNSSAVTAETPALRVIYSRPANHVGSSPKGNPSESC